MLKKTGFFLLLGAFCCQAALAQKDSRRLQKADSLFTATAYEAAFPLYQQVLRWQQAYSERMLWRMAYVQEGLGHYPAALYYLSLAQAHHPQQATWAKMAELAQHYRLTGYPNTWQQQLRITFRRSYYRLLQALLVGAVLGATVLFARRRRSQRGWWIAYGVYLTGVGLVLNLLAPARNGLVMRPRAALMAGPSPGATWLTTAAAGDRLVVLGRQDVWYRVQWQGQDAYIRQHDVLMID